MNDKQKIFLFFNGYSLGLIILGLLVRFSVWRWTILLLPLWFISPFFIMRKMKKQRQEETLLPKKCPNPKCRSTLKRDISTRARALLFGSCPKCGEHLHLERKVAAKRIAFSDTKYISANSREYWLIPAIFLGLYLFFAALEILFLVPPKSDRAAFTAAVKGGNLLIMLGYSFLIITFSPWLEVRFKSFFSKAITCPQCGKFPSVMWNNLVRISGNCPFCGMVIMMGLPDAQVQNQLKQSAFELSIKKKRVLIGIGIFLLVLGFAAAYVVTRVNYNYMIIPIVIGFLFLVLFCLLAFYRIPKCPVCRVRLEDFNTVLRTGRCLKCGNIILENNKNAMDRP